MEVIDLLLFTQKDLCCLTWVLLYNVLYMSHLHSTGGVAVPPEKAAGESLRGISLEKAAGESRQKVPPGNAAAGASYSMLSSSTPGMEDMRVRRSVRYSRLGMWRTMVPL